MGSDEAEVERLVQETGKDWFKCELPRHTVEVDSFALARYPTTNTMFACFVESGGYAAERWWPEAIAARRWVNGRVRDISGDVRDRPAYWDDARFSNPNQPVVGVTWYEAVAYCRWLTAMLEDSHKYRLPTEAEWECAARSGLPAGEGDEGGTGRRYPWGDDWQAGYANTRELGLERTTPVGIFPEDELDLCGNVWEWCSDWFDKGTYRRRAGHVEKNPTGPAEGTAKALRGGSWYNGYDIVRCASRVKSSPVDWYNIVGFRVARGSFS